MTGCWGQGVAPDVARPLTGVEEGLLDNVTDCLQECIVGGWKRFGDFTFEVVERVNLTFVQVIPAQEMVLVATFGVQAPGSMSQVSYVYVYLF